MAFNHFTRNLLRLSCSNNIQLSSNRMYARWAHRQPSRVLLQTIPTSGSSLKKEEVIELDADAMRLSRENHAVKVNASVNKNISSKQNSLPAQSVKNHVPCDTSAIQSRQLEKPAHIDSEKIKKQRQQELETGTNKVLARELVFDENGEIIYDKLNKNDGRVSTLVTNLKCKKGRIRSNKVLVEGWRIIVDGLQAGCSLKYVMFSRKSDLDNIKPHLPSTGVKLYKLPYKEIQLWSNVDTSSGILGVFEMPSPTNIIIKEPCLPVNIICDNVRDPGNLGAILRACVGAGCDQVYLMKGCVDLWEPKVIRSAAGAHFRLPIHTYMDWDTLPTMVDPSTSVFIADNNFKVELSDKFELYEDIDQLKVPIVPYYSVDYSTSHSITLIIGGETEGISEESYRFAAYRNGLRVNIPLQAGVDSLNTGMATAVIAFEIKKQIIEAKKKLHGANIG